VPTVIENQGAYVILRKLVVSVAAVAAAAGGMLAGSASSATAAGGGWGYGHAHIDCANNRYLCAEVGQPEKHWNHYVGHDEPTLMFYSNAAGSGNRMSYSGVLPRQPAPTNVPGKRSYDFELFPAIWFGMVMCSTQSYPETVRTCIPDSNHNITSPSDPYHPGAAYMELQLYPPGYVQQWNGFSCSATRWCAALTIDSYGVDPVTGKTLNSSCASKVGLEWVNFAYLTHSGKPQGPPNPVQFSPTKSGTPNPKKVLFLNPGDHYSVTIHDTKAGLQTVLHDWTSGQSGSMTASAANGFGQVAFKPSGTECKNLPYNFHPMYSTSSPRTITPWAAATYNVAFDTEIGHFDYCSNVNSSGACAGYEGVGANREKADGDDYGCFPPSASSLIMIGGCEASNIGYDGTSYLKDWPDSLTAVNRPSPLYVTSPLTGSKYNENYARVAFNTDLPAIENEIGQCNDTTGKGCNHIPLTDDGTRAAFYPYYTSGHSSVLGGCAWTVGQSVPGFTNRSYNKNNEYGHLLKNTYTTKGGGSVRLYQDFNRVLGTNTCPAGR
jgi:hypothetical protein